MGFGVRFFAGVGYSIAHTEFQRQGFQHGATQPSASRTWSLMRKRVFLKTPVRENRSRDPCPCYRATGSLTAMAGLGGERWRFGNPYAVYSHC